ncbi:4-phosphoerythronate dehydrogenase [Duncaniella freteri]|jgi:erythronate-4-phosphate dehydrogenase|uniref:Erythronate-4-phosphate dehydrogenase n=5 Tax=Duncaniella TaxID=2518495 RepID=A0A4Z0V683_9BACT|nr:4-phosphoerythronate dehydrogenase [Duncaniella freteri]TGG39794.1 4-phosphoerythronate dehydrogenase [Duncaniella freteri]
MKIIFDRNIPFVSKPLSSIGEAIPMTGTEITNETVKDADAIIIRTRTRCDATLLKDSKCRFIGTATIGTDHIDLPYCASRGITVANAPGCNAPAVAQWVLSAISTYLGDTRSLSDITLGVIGAGNVGSVLIRWAEGLGIKTIVNDPPLQRQSSGSYRFSSLSDIADKCDVITVHTPLTRTGDHPTYHLIDNSFISNLKRRPLILNAARGPVTDTLALINGLESGKISALGIDCWEGEPNINLQLLEQALIATPHIAGYSRQGKIRASQMVLDELSHHLRLDIPLSADAPSVAPVPHRIIPDMLNYDILEDTRILKSSPSLFESLRNNYHLREEPSL